MKTLIQRTAAVVLGILLGGIAWAGLETVTHISDLNSSWPLGSDLASTSDDHIRNIKVALKTDFPNVNAAVTGTPTQLNNLTTNITFSGSVATIPSINITNSSVPANGIYLPAANTLGFSSNTTKWGSVNSTGNWVLVTPTSGTGLVVNGVSTGVSAQFTDGTTDFRVAHTGGSTTVGTSTNTSLKLGTNGNAHVTIDNAGATTISAPSAGDALTTNAVANANALTVTSPNTASQSFGAIITAGTNSSDTSLRVRNAAGTSSFLVRGDQAIQGFGSVAATLVDMSPDTTTTTATLTGCTTSPTTTVRLSRTGNLVIGSIDGAVTCTSNATTFTLTGAIPSSFQPARAQYLLGICTDSGAASTCTMSFASGSQTITFGKVPAPFTSSGSKGITIDGAVFAYQLR